MTELDILIVISAPETLVNTRLPVVSSTVALTSPIFALLIELTTFDNSSVAAIETAFPLTVTVDEVADVVSVDETEHQLYLAVVAAVAVLSSAAFIQF